MTKNGKNFDHFKNLLCKEKAITDKMRDDYLEARRAAQNDIDAIRNRRNKVLAHSDREHFDNPDIFLENEPVDFEVIDKLLENMLAICQIVIIQSKEYAFSHIYISDSEGDFVRLFG